MEHAVIAMFDDFAQAQRAKDELLKAGFQANDVQMSPSDETEESRRSALGGRRDSDGSEDSGWSIGSFFKSLFGSDDEAHREHSDTYSEALRRGSFMVSVDANSEEMQERASAVLLNCDPVDIEGRSQAWRSQGWSGYDSNAPLYTQDDISRERQSYSTTSGAAGFDTHRTSASSGMGSGADSGMATAGGLDNGVSRGVTGTANDTGVDSSVGSGMVGAHGLGSSLAGSDMAGTSGIERGTETGTTGGRDLGSSLTGSGSDMAGTSGIGSDTGMTGTHRQGSSLTSSGSDMTDTSGMDSGSDAGITRTHGMDSSLTGSGSDTTGSSGIGSGTDTRLSGTPDEDRTMGRSDTGMMGTSATGSGIGSGIGSGMGSGTDTGMAGRRDFETSTPGNMQDQTRMPIVEEALNVGKRAVSGGGVRVFRRVTERPVEESVNLRQEQVHVERHPVDRPVGEVGADAFKEQSFELRETTEEPVVSKVARVVEEVEIGKEVTSRDETVRDTVRRADVEVENLGAENLRQDTAGSGMSTDDSAYRSHWQNSFASSGGRYEDYAPAYQYGSTLAADERYRGHQWNDIEPHVRTDWESRNSGSTWERAKEAVRYGWEKMTH